MHVAIAATSNAVPRVPRRASRALAHVLAGALLVLGGIATADGAPPALQDALRQFADSQVAGHGRRDGGHDRRGRSPHHARAVCTL